MDWSRITDEHRKTLRRIVAVLLALADVAERCSDRSLAVRRLVLWLLRPGEVIARNYLVGLMPSAGQAEPMTARCEYDSAAEAIRLALSFRRLAAALAALAGEVFPSWHLAVAQVRSPAALGARAALRTPATAVERRDSS